MNSMPPLLLAYLATTIILFCWTTLALRNWARCHRTGEAPSRLLRWHFLSYAALLNGSVYRAPCRSDALNAFAWYGALPFFNSAILSMMFIASLLGGARDLFLWTVGGAEALERWLKVELT
jgi:hypothetical protein